MTQPRGSDRTSVDRRRLLALGGGAAGLAAASRVGAASERQDAGAAPSGRIQAGSGGRIEVERLAGGVLLIGLDRPEQQNRLTMDMFLELAAAYHLLETDNALRVGVLHGRGPDFCVGLDVQEWAARLAAGPFTLDPAKHVNPVGTAGALRTKPVVVVVQGATWMLGHELFLAADIRVAATTTRFSQGEVMRGLFPGGGGTIRMVQEAGRANALRYILTGDEWDAAESRRLGLTQEITPAGQQLDRAVAFAQKIARAAPLGVRAVLRSLNTVRLEGEQAAYAGLLPAFGQLFRTEDFRERVRAAQENRPPVYQGR